jgi:tetratricopeptide (TPR) repeat protein
VTPAPESAVRVSLLPRGSSIGRYVILEQLGIGGMGAVYSAYDTQLDRRVALKFLRVPPEEEAAEEWRARLTREAQAMARLSHPNVVTVFDASVTPDGRVFLAMEYVEGGTLTDWLQRRKRTWREVLDVMCRAGEGLAAAHQAGMIHRDFKLDNVLLGGEDGPPKVTDFGLARAAGRVDRPAGAPAEIHPAAFRPTLQWVGSSTSLSSRLTMTGSLLGTPGYMAPEQYGTDEDGIDERADIFAFCATCYRALYGQRPFAGERLEDVALATINGKVCPPPAGSDAPAWVHRVLVRGLSVDARARPASMTELLAELRADPAKRKRRLIALAAAGVAAVAVGLGVHAATQQRVRACHATAGALDGAWGEPRKRAAAEAFRRTGLSYAERTWERVERALDGYGAAWSSSQEQACLATRVRGERSEAAYELESACLEERLDGLRALGDVFVSADGKTVQNAVKAVHELAPIDACSNLDRLSVGSRLPGDPSARARIRALQGELAGAKALIDAGKLQQGVDVLERARQRVEDSQYGPLLVTRMLLAGEAMEPTNPNAAVAAYEEAVAEADAYRLDELKVEASILAGTLDADWLDRYEDARRWLRLARGALQRIGNEARLEVWLEIEEGWGQVYAGNQTDLFERALDRARTAGIDDPRRRASAYAGMAEMVGHLGHAAEACGYDRRSIAEFEDAVGPEHPLVAQFLGDLARDQLAAGAWSDALASTQRALGILEADAQRGDVAAESHQRGYVEQQMGIALLRLGRAQGAIDHLGMARDLLRMTDGGDNRGSLVVDNELAEAHRVAGELAEAAVALDEAHETEGRMHDVSLEVAGTLAERAKVSLDRGDPAGALAPAERALALRTQDGSRDVYGMADARLVVARALASRGSELARATDLAERARDGFADLHDAQRTAEAARVAAELAEESARPASRRTSRVR